MSDTLEFPVIRPSIEPEMVSILRQIHEQLAANADATDRGSKSAEKQEGAIKSLNTAWGMATSAWSAGRQALGSVIEMADGIAALADEQAHLTENATRLSLDFDQASAAAGRFSDETESMGAATAFAARNIRLTQEQLEAITRTAGPFSRDMGITTKAAIDQLSDAVMNGSDRALRPFGHDLEALAGPSHTVQERLAALTVHAQHVTPAVDDASDALARYRDQIGDAERLGASAFTAELMRLGQLQTGFRDASTGAEDFNDKVRAVGQAAAYTLNVVGNLVGVVLGAIGMAVTTAVGGIRVAASAVNAMVHGESPSDAAMAQLRESFGAGSAASDMSGFLLGSGRNLRDLATETDGRTSAGGAVRGLAAADNNMVFTSDVALEQSGSGNDRGHGGAGRNRPNWRNQKLLDAAAFERQRQIDFEEWTAQKDAETASFERGRQVAENDNAMGKAAAQRQASEAAFEASPEQRLARRRQDADRQREGRDLEQRYELQRSFTDRMEEMHYRRVNFAQMEAEGVSKAFEIMGGATANTIQNIIAGRQTLEQGVKAWTATIATGIGNEAMMKGGMELGEAAAAAAGVVTAPLAAGHLAAAGIYFGIGGAASALGAALSVGPQGGGGGGGASTATPKTQLAPSNNNGASGETRVMNVYYNAPVIDGRRATRDQVGAELGGYTDAATRERRVGRAA